MILAFLDSESELEAPGCCGAMLRGSSIIHRFFFSHLQWITETHLMRMLVLLDLGGTHPVP